MFHSTKGADDIYSVSDQGLADTFKFIEEVCITPHSPWFCLIQRFQVGFGNWGSVWLCEQRIASPGSQMAIDICAEEPLDCRVAVKIVHRNKTPTTSARVRSL